MKSKQIIINDANIDYSTAVCWCAFSSKDFQSFAEESIQTIDKLTKQAKEKFKDKNKDNNKDNKEALNESIYQFFITEHSKKYNKKDGFFKGSLKALGKTTKKLVKTTTKLAGNLIAKTLKFATKLAVKGLLSATKLTAKGVLWVVKKTYATITPWAKAKSKAVFSLGAKSNSLAFTKFKCNDKKYIFTYNLEKNKWILAYQGVGGLFNNDSVPSKSEITSFKKTKLYKAFVKKCSSIIKKYLDKDAFIGILAANTTTINSDVGRYLMTIQNNKENIKNNMFTGNIQLL